LEYLQNLVISRRMAALPHAQQLLLFSQYTKITTLVLLFDFYFADY
jgi:hypothetical protein